MFMRRYIYDMELVHESVGNFMNFVYVREPILYLKEKFFKAKKAYIPKSR